jgi:hypothetical protein
MLVPQIAPREDGGGSAKFVGPETPLVKAGTIASDLQAFAHLHDALRL